jgi:GTP cyclohydrolase IA
MAARSSRKRASLNVAAIRRPTREQAEEAVRVLLRWAGDDPAR